MTSNMPALASERKNAFLLSNSQCESAQLLWLGRAVVGWHRVANLHGPRYRNGMRMHRVALGLVLSIVACGGSARSDGQQAPSSDAGGGDAGGHVNGDAGGHVNGDAGDQANGDAGEPGQNATDGGGAGGEPGSAGAAGQRSECSGLDCLAGAHLSYQPTRTWHAPAGSIVPTSELSETDYTPLLGEPIALTFSDDASAVELIPSAGGTTVHGSRNPTRKDRAWYDLDFFAGGRFVVSLAEGQYVAEYTIYGSGRPIVSSTRGTLSSSPR